MQTACDGADDALRLHVSGNYNRPPACVYQKEEGSFTSDTRTSGDARVDTDDCPGDDAQASSLRLPWAPAPSFWHLLCPRYRLSEFLSRIKILILYPGCSFPGAWEDHRQPASHGARPAVQEAADGSDGECDGASAGGGLGVTPGPGPQGLGLPHLSAVGQVPGDGRITGE